MNINVLGKFTVEVQDCNIEGSKGPDVRMITYYSEDGGYISAESFDALVVKREIMPQKSRPENKVCSIGKSIKDGKWYGWSHRAIFGFQIGDKVKKGDCTNESGLIADYLKDHPEEDRSLPIGFEAKTEHDCRLMATAFADSVS